MTPCANDAGFDILFGVPAIGGKKPTEHGTWEAQNDFPAPASLRPCAFLTLLGRGFYMEVRNHDEQQDSGKDREEVCREAQNPEDEWNGGGGAQGAAHAVGAQLASIA